MLCFHGNFFCYFVDFCFNIYYDIFSIWRGLMNYIFFAGTILILPILYFILNRYVKKHRDWILKSFSLFLAVVFFIRYYSVSGSLLTNVWSLSSNSYCCILRYGNNRWPHQRALTYSIKCRHNKNRHRAWSCRLRSSSLSLI